MQKIKELDFFPLLTNCDHIEKTLSDDSLFPVPPYKDEYQTFLQKVKEHNEKKEPNNNIDVLRELIKNLNYYTIL